MTTYYVATLARYVLVEAANEDEACRLAKPKLYDLYAEVRREFGMDTPIRIQTVRPATPEEIELQDWHEEVLADEPGCEFCQQDFNRPDGTFKCPYCGQAWNAVAR
jgi:hypothetical protein